MAHQHPYAVQTAALYLSSIPALGIVGLFIGARIEALRRTGSLPSGVRATGPKPQFGHGVLPGFEALQPE
jgi:hypothetical protein